jgi:predicted dehydrogenase
MNQSRRDFLKKTAYGTAGIAMGSMLYSPSGFARIVGSNNKIRVGIVGFSDRFKYSLFPAFLNYAEEMNFEIVAVSDIWNRRREEAVAYIKEKTGKTIIACRNNEELYEKVKPDAVIISTADFQHARHAIEAVKAGCDAYVEKPFAETMEDNRAALKAILDSKKIVQIGSQRRSGTNYQAAADYVKSGKFGKITMVEMTWNVNQPGRWRRPELVASIKESDTDWKRFLVNRPYENWDPRKYLEYRLFWPYSSGIPGQWMSHQIDTVHWFSGYPYPRSVAANGGIYMWKDGRKNPDTMTAVFDYGPKENSAEGFQVLYSSRMHNSAGSTKEWYFSNGGKLDLDKNVVTSEGGLQEEEAKAMGMKANLLEEYHLPDMKAEAGAVTGSDPLTSAHMHNWMESVRSRQTPHADVWAGYHHSIANIMTNAALRTGAKVVFDEKNQEVIANGVVFKY